MKIISNTAMSLDGRISTVESGHVTLGSDEDLLRMSIIRAKADAVLVGGNTFRNWSLPLVPKPEFRTRDLIKNPLWNVVVSRRMDFRLTEKFLGERSIRPLFLTNSRTELKLFPAEVVACDGEITPQWIVDVLSERGVKTLLIEGGGELIAQFLAADLLDEMYVTVCPRLIGGAKAPSLVAGPGFGPSAIRNLRLVATETVASEVFLHYEVLKKLHGLTQHGSE